MIERMRGKESRRNRGKGGDHPGVAADHPHRTHRVAGNPVKTGGLPWPGRIGRICLTGSDLRREEIRLKTIANVRLEASVHAAKNGIGGVEGQRRLGGKIARGVTRVTASVPA